MLKEKQTIKQHTVQCELMHMRLNTAFLLPHCIRMSLRGSDVITMLDLAVAPDEHILSLKGIGPVRLHELRQWQANLGFATEANDDR